MDELLKQATEFFREGTAFFRRIQKEAAGAASQPAQEAPKRGRPPKAEKPVVNEAESEKRAAEMGAALMDRYPEKRDGYPEGWHIARKILGEAFKVQRLKDLNHEQRLKFIALVQDELAAAAPAPALAELDV